MIRIYEKVNGKLVESQGFSQDCLIYLVSPTSAEIDDISQKLSIDSDLIYDSLDPDERARIDISGKSTLLILKVPYRDEDDKKIPYKTASLGILIGSDYTLLISKFNLEFLDIMIKRSEFNPHKKSRMIFQIFYRNALLFLAYLKEINKITDRTEERLHESMRNNELETLMYLEKSLVYFTTSLRSNEIMMEKILRGTTIEIFDADKELLEDTIIEYKQALEMANIYSDILSGMMDAFASVISNNLNVVMKVLTILTLVIQIPAIITGFFGMNVKVPFSDNPYAFIYIISVCVVVCVLVYFIFRNKKWM
ncbi:MAG TPA: magnesium transporter CorA family protein [Petrotogaceae bacterium]|nr:magnesium transporter CorA family protein [Petrotogaceae bacterium]